MNKRIKYYCFFVLIYVFIVLLSSCNSEINEIKKEEDPIKYKYGYDESKYLFEEKKVGKGDTFGDILEGQGIDYPEIYQALQRTKNEVDFRKLQIGKPYTLIYTKDSIRKLKAFVYHPTIEGYSLIQLRDSVFVIHLKKLEHIKIYQHQELLTTHYI